MSIKTYITAGILVFGAWHAYGNYQEDQQKLASVAKEYGLNAQQQAAFHACNAQMSGLQTGHPDAQGKGSVPPQICACQSKHMVGVFQPDQYSSHKNVINSVTENSTAAQNSLDASEMHSKYTPEQGFELLRFSLKSCFFEYQSIVKAKYNQKIKNLCKKPDMKNHHVCKS